MMLLFIAILMIDGFDQPDWLMVAAVLVFFTEEYFKDDE